MPKLTENARAELDRALASSLDKLAEHDQAAEVLAEFLAGRALLVLSRDELRIMPVDDDPAAVPAAQDTPEPPMPGMYL